MRKALWCWFIFVVVIDGLILAVGHDVGVSYGLLFKRAEVNAEYQRRLRVYRQEMADYQRKQEVSEHKRATRQAEIQRLRKRCRELETLSLTGSLASWDRNERALATAKARLEELERPLDPLTYVNEELVSYPPEPQIKESPGTAIAFVLALPILAGLLLLLLLRSRLAFRLHPGRIAFNKYYVAGVEIRRFHRVVFATMALLISGAEMAFLDDGHGGPISAIVAVLCSGVLTLLALSGMYLKERQVPVGFAEKRKKEVRTAVAAAAVMVLVVMVGWVTVEASRFQLGSCFRSPAERNF